MRKGNEKDYEFTGLKNFIVWIIVMIMLEGKINQFYRYSNAHVFSPFDILTSSLMGIECHAIDILS